MVAQEPVIFLNSIRSHTSTRPNWLQCNFMILASEWYDSYLIDHKIPGWDELIRLVSSRFYKIISKNSLNELKCLNQVGSVDEYWHHFEKLCS
jgi:predicted membrane-bound spermidine synthase